MIDNDPNRSFEFISDPRLAGSAAKRYPFPLAMIVAIYALCAIVGVLLLSLLSAVMPPDAISLTPRDDMSPMEKQLFQSMKAIMDFLSANPLISVILNAGMKLVVLFLTYLVGKKFNPTIDFLPSLSALTRFEIMRSAVFAALQIIEILMWMLSPTAGGAFGIVTLSTVVFMFVIQIKFIQGVFELSGTGKALGLIFAVYLALLAVMFLLSLINLVMLR